MLSREETINKLNWFYTLEMNQVELYEAQSDSVTDTYLQRTLVRVAAIEQGHVENISAKIKDLGGKPTIIGGVTAFVAGKAAGMATGWAGTINLLKANIKLEEKAMADYKDFILKAGKDQDLFDLLWSNLIDEDLHTAWFANKVKQLEQH